MPSRTTQTPQGPILELWRIVALVLIVAAGMLFVHMVVPADASTDPIGTGPAPGHTGQP